MHESGNAFFDGCECAVFVEFDDDSFNSIALFVFLFGFILKDLS